MILPAVGVDLAYRARKRRWSQIPRRPHVADVRNSGPAEACTIDTLSSVRGRKARKILLELIGTQGRERALPPMTTGALDPLPARSNGLDNVDGGPDAAFYIQIGII
jgi:hypothetical protein